MKIEKFEDLLVWQKSRQMVLEIYKITAKFPKSERYNLVDQINRCVVSVAANIAEGFSRYHLKESVLFYRNARGSLAELKSHLYLSFDLGYINNVTLDRLLSNIDEIGKMLNGLINSTRRFRVS